MRLGLGTFVIAITWMLTPVSAGVFTPNSTEGFRYTESRVTPPLIVSGRDALDTLLKDYQTARFRHVFAHFLATDGTLGKQRFNAGWFFCGEVDSKNSLGGYDGWKGFLLLGGRAYSEDNAQYWGLCLGYNTLPSQYDPTRDYSAELAYKP